VDLAARRTSLRASGTAPRVARRRQSIVELFARKLVVDYLYKRRREFLGRYPQLSCFAFDAITESITVDGQYEREEIEFVLTSLADRFRGRTVLDIGANIGNHALAFAELAGRVIALEPHPRTFRLLVINAQDRANVLPLNIGASDRSETVTAFTPPGNAGGCRIGEAQAGEQVELEVRPLDDLPECTDVGLVKIDVEGHEEPWRLPFGKAGHLLEAIATGIPPTRAVAVPITRLEQRNYACLIAASEPL
jgi:FkbM family methyltransferase